MCAIGKQESTFSIHTRESLTIKKSSLISLPFHEIPTALVFAGINTPDHGTQFAHIASKLREPTYPHKKHHVALLQSKDCLNIKNMVKTMIERFLMDSPDLSKAGSSHQSFVENHVDNEDDMDDDEDIIRPVEVICSMHSILI